jgi:hypothetical protein
MEPGKAHAKSCSKDRALKVRVHEKAEADSTHDYLEKQLAT